jgi:hypothetical protein
MITPKLTNNINCASVEALLADINCKLSDMAKMYYNNIRFMLNKPRKDDVMWDLLHYKRILTYRMYNSEYASDYTLEKIASRVKLLKYKL